MLKLALLTAVGLTAVVLAPVAVSQAAEHPELKPYPAAKEGQTRFVIVLPHKERGEENAFAVELIIGKTIMTDGVNRTFLGSALKTRTLEGWGYPYYEVTGSGAVGSTLIGVPPGTPQVEKFVAGRPLKINYNSRLPIVVYAPQGFELKYRIWKAGEEMTADEG